MTLVFVCKLTSIATNMLSYSFTKVGSNADVKYISVFVAHYVNVATHQSILKLQFYVSYFGESYSRHCSDEKRTFLLNRVCCNLLTK